MMQINSVINIREEFAQLLNDRQFTSINREKSMVTLMGSKTIEIISANFVANSDVIFGELNPSYQKREEDWYKSMSLNVNDIPGGPPDVWKAIAASDGTINSNYGWAVWSGDNFKQFNKVVCELKKNPESRRAVVIYTRPSMWFDYNHKGRSDFMCTNVVQYVVREGVVNAIVQMRSNDSFIGYKNDRAWQLHVLTEVANSLGYPVGRLYWQVGSLHVYERNFYVVHHYSKTGEVNITKAKYRELYPDSTFLEKT